MASDDGNRAAAGEGAQLAKATEKLLVEKIKADVGGNVVASFTRTAKISIHREIRTIHDMTTETKTAIVESSRNQYAVPAQEQTARSVQQTKRLRIAAVVASVGAFLIYLKPEAGWPIVGVVGMLETGIAFTEYFNREKRKGKRRDQSSTQED